MHISEDTQAPHRIEWKAQSTVALTNLVCFSMIVVCISHLSCFTGCYYMFFFCVSENVKVKGVRKASCPISPQNTAGTGSLIGCL